MKKARLLVVSALAAVMLGVGGCSVKETWNKAKDKVVSVFKKKDTKVSTEKAAQSDAKAADQKAADTKKK